MQIVMAAAAATGAAVSAPDSKKADTFEVGSLALGFHGPKLYEAKVYWVGCGLAEPTYSNPLLALCPLRCIC